MTRNATRQCGPSWRCSLTALRRSGQRASLIPRPPHVRLALPSPILVNTGCADLVVLGLRGSDQSLRQEPRLGPGDLRARYARCPPSCTATSDATVRLEGIPYRAEYAANAAYLPGQHRRRRRRDASPHRPARQELPRDQGRSRRLQPGRPGGSRARGRADRRRRAKRVALVAMIADPRRNPADSIASWTYGKAAPGPGKLGAGPALGVDPQGPGHRVLRRPATRSATGRPAATPGRCRRRIGTSTRRPPTPARPGTSWPRSSATTERRQRESPRPMAGGFRVWCLVTSRTT